MRPVEHHGSEMASVLRSKVHTTRPSQNLSEFFAGESNSRCVQNGSHLLDVFPYDVVEKSFIAVLKRSEVNELGEVGGVLPVIPQHSVFLFFDVGSPGRHQASQS